MTVSSRNSGLSFVTTRSEKTSKIQEWHPTRTSAVTLLYCFDKGSLEPVASGLGALLKHCDARLLHSRRETWLRVPLQPDVDIRIPSEPFRNPKQGQARMSEGDPERDSAEFRDWRSFFLRPANLSACLSVAHHIECFTFFLPRASHCRR